MGRKDQAGAKVKDAAEKTRDKVVDLADKASIVAMYQQLGTVDAVICAAGAAKFAPLESLTDDDFTFSLTNKLMGQVNLVRCSVGHVTQGGSLTLRNVLEITSRYTALLGWML